jgi:hypothetical protein
MKLGKNQERLPSGVIATKNRKYFYWSCSKTGLMTFANAERFAKVVASYGSEEELVSQFVAAPVKKYLAEGWDVEAIKGIISANKGKLPPIGGKKVKAEKVKKVRKTSLKSFAMASLTVPVQQASGSFEAEKKPVYPWSNDPDYFRSPTRPLGAAEATKDSCAYPNRYLDVRCKGCSIYDACVFKGKYAPSDWKKNTSRNEVIIKDLKSFEN